MFKSKKEKGIEFFKSLSKEERFEWLNQALTEEEKEELLEEKEEPEVEPKKEKVEPKVEEETKEEPKVEEPQFDIEKFKNEIKEQIREEIAGLNLEEKFKPYVTKDEFEEVKKEIPKAKEFGVEPKPTSVEETDFEKSAQEVLKNLN